jgi:hypothetical protein
MALTSPGIEIKEQDKTLIVPNVSSTVGGIAGRFTNGPIGVPTLISTEADLANTFGYPNDSNFPEWFAAAEFLKYSGSAYVVRAVATDAKTSVQTVPVGGAPLFKTREDFEEQLMGDATIASGSYGTWASKLPGDIGNTLSVIAVDSGNWSSFETYANQNVNLYGLNLLSLFSQPPKTSPWAQEKIVNGSGAKFNVTTSGGAVSGVSIVSGGENYPTSGCYLEFNGSGVGASATVTIKNGVITKINIDDAGSYTVAPSITISAPTGAGGVTATATVAVDGGKIGSVTITDGGSGYESIPTISSSGGTGSGLVLSVPAIGGIKNGIVTAVSVDNGGSGYGTAGVWATLFNPSIDDEIHVLVIDNGGLIGGVPNRIVEKYEGLSKIKDAKNTSNSDNYYKTTINNSSNLIYWLSTPATGTSNFNIASDGNKLAWDQDIKSVITTIVEDGKVFKQLYNFSPFAPVSLTGGANGSTVTDGEIKEAYDLLANVDMYDVACFPTGAFSVDVVKHVVENVASKRGDAMAFLSPYDYKNSDLSINKYVLFKNANDMIAYKQNELAIADQYAQYAVMDSGWKYIFDKYNNKYRWVPMNGDIAGIVARLETTSEAWFSPGGFDRGGVKNVLKLSWNPTQSERDAIYPKGINPVVVLPSGGGTVLYGDRTMTSKPSAFDRINVRRLFNILEKSIGQMAKYKLFEINDNFTRSDFKTKVDSYLRDIQGRRGITEFLTVCDSSNNTGDVIDRNEFRASIYIKPTRSINFVTLTFVATSTGVDFSTVVGR